MVILVMSKHRLIGLIVLAAIVLIAIQLLPSHQKERNNFDVVSLNIPSEPALSPNQKEENTQATYDGQTEPEIDHQAKEVEITLAKEDVKQSLPKIVTANPAEQYNNGWVVQLASYSSDKYADILVDKLKSAGYDAFTYKTVVHNAQAVRVYVGPVTNIKEAELLTGQLTNAVGIKGIIVRYEVDQL